jgi:hypothetical protein
MAAKKSAIEYKKYRQEKKRTNRKKSMKDLSPSYFSWAFARFQPEHSCPITFQFPYEWTRFFWNDIRQLIY